MAHPLDGKWSYRSFLNNPDLDEQPDSLLFGAGTMDIAVAADGTVSGTLGGSGWSLSLEGTVHDGVPVCLRVTGSGPIGGETWVYDYLGYLVPDWPEGVDQRDALVGSVIRSEPHSGGAAEAGFVASFYAPRQ